MMQMAYLVLVMVCLSGAVQAIGDLEKEFRFERISGKEVHSLTAQSEDNIRRGDEYVDKLIHDIIEERIDEYDPYRMEDSVVGFSKKVLFVNVSGEAKLNNGILTGLRTLHRAQHCSLNQKNGRLHVHAILGAGELNLKYDGSVKFMQFGPTITVHGLVHYIEVTMRFNVDANTGKDGRLEEFAINDLRGMKVWTSGLGPMTWAMNPIITGVNKIFQRFIRNLIESKLERHFSERLPQFQFPVEGRETSTSEVTKSTTQQITEMPSTTSEATESISFSTTITTESVTEKSSILTSETENTETSDKEIIITSEVTETREDVTIETTETETTEDVTIETTETETTEHVTIETTEAETTEDVTIETTETETTEDVTIETTETEITEDVTTETPEI